MDNIFIFRSCPMERFKEILGGIKKENKDAYIVVITNIEEGLKENPVIDRLIIYPFRKFRISLFLWVVLRENLRNCLYDSIIVPFNDYTSKNYSNVLLCALLLRGKRIIGLNIEGRERPFYKKDISRMFFKSLYELLLFLPKILILLFAMIVNLRTYPKVRI